MMNQSELQRTINGQRLEGFTDSLHDYQLMKLIELNFILFGKKHEDLNVQDFKERTNKMIIKILAVNYSDPQDQQAQKDLISFIQTYRGKILNTDELILEAIKGQFKKRYSSINALLSRVKLSISIQKEDEDHAYLGIGDGENLRHRNLGPRTFQLYPINGGAYVYYHKEEKNDRQSIKICTKLSDLFRMEMTIKDPDFQKMLTADYYTSKETNSMCAIMRGLIRKLIKLDRSNDIQLQL